MNTTEAAHRADLVQRIEERSGHCLSSPIRDAFLVVSRFHFVPTFYEQEQPGQWVERENSLESVYQDVPLITKVNAANLPCSSSSQPSLMAAMLEALDLRPGQRVLEIGTGTGY